MLRSGMCVALLSCVALPAFAGNGPFGIDHLVTYDNSGIWNRDHQKQLAMGAALTVIGGALFVDKDTRIGKTFDQSLDAMVFTAGTTTVMKYAFSRERPSENTDPDSFFSGSGHQSFPSGEVAEISAVVTPFIAEYGHDHPAVWALAVLPAYDAVARVKVHGHWQSDVLAGAAIGVAWGVWAHRRPTPFIVEALPKGMMVAYQKTF